MMREDALKHLNKRVFIQLKSGMRFNGLVLEVNHDCIYINDKFDEKVSIALEDISFIMNKNRGVL